MKKLLSALLCLMLMISAFSIGSITASAEEFTQTGAEFITNIKVGFNLGNTFEAWQGWNTWPDDISTITPEYSETGWNNPKTTQAMIDEVANAGFNAIRIPVTWRNFIVDNGNGTYTIRQEWLDRVKEVVGYAQNNDMYIIVNMHHDDKDWLDITKTGDEWDAIVEKYRQIWNQIATEFKDYDEKLILEAANEIVGGNDWWGKQDYYFDNMTELYKCFIKTVRETGGNNAKRYLMLPTYGAQWYSHQIDKVYLPEDDNHIIMDVHWYTSSTDIKELNTYMSHFAKMTLKKGYGAVFGECGLQKSASNTTKAAWPVAYMGTAMANGIPCFIWDDGGNFQQLDRRNLVWTSDAYISAIMATVNDESYSTLAPITTKATTTVKQPTNEKWYEWVEKDTLTEYQTKSAKDYDISYSGGWADSNTTYTTVRDGIRANSNDPDACKKQIQYLTDINNASEIVEAARELNGKIAFDVYGTFTTGDDEDVRCYFRMNLPNVGWTTDFDIIMESDTKYTLLVDPELLPLDWKTIQVQYNNYNNFGDGLYAPELYLTLPYIVYSGTTTTTTTTEAPAPTTADDTTAPVVESPDDPTTVVGGKYETSIVQDPNAPVAADDSINVFTIDDKTVKAGDTIEVPVVLSNVDKIWGAQLNIAFDTKGLEFVSFAKGDVFADVLENKNDVADGYISVLLSHNLTDGTDVDNVHEGGVVFTLTLKVLDTAAEGTYGIAFVNFDAESFFEIENDTVDVAFKSAIITVEEEEATEPAPEETTAPAPVVTETPDAPVDTPDDVESNGDVVATTGADTTDANGNSTAPQTGAAAAPIAAAALAVAAAVVVFKSRKK